MSHWESVHTWMCPPVALAGDVLPRHFDTSLWSGSRGSGICWARSIGATFRRSRLTASGSGSDNDDAVGCSLRNYPVI
jgi:hypothetical protein